MADYLTTDTELTSVANAIRTKGGTSAALEWPGGFAQAIADISSGGSVETAQIAISGATSVHYTDGTMTVQTASGDVTTQAAIGSIAVTYGAPTPLFTTTGVSLLFSYNRSTICVYEVTG